jgi:hypothetical protein
VYRAIAPFKSNEVEAVWMLKVVALKINAAVPLLTAAGIGHGVSSGLE